MTTKGEDNYNFTWTVTDYYEKQLKLKIKWDNPSATGLFDETDYLNVTFKSNETIRGSGAEYIWRDNINIWTEMPR